MKYKNDVVSQWNKVCENTITLDDFVRENWQEFKPMWINQYGYCSDEAELYLFVHKFLSKIYRSDVQPIFYSDGQLFQYFKTAIKNQQYDDIYKAKKKISEYSLDAVLADRKVILSSDQDTVEDKIQDYSRPFEDYVDDEDSITRIISQLGEELSSKYMDIIILMFEYDFNVKEVSQALGMSLNTVRNRICVIRDKLIKICGYKKTTKK